MGGGWRDFEGEMMLGWGMWYKILARIIRYVFRWRERGGILEAFGHAQWSDGGL